MKLRRAVFAANTGRDGRGDQLDISDPSTSEVLVEGVLACTHPKNICVAI